MSNLGLMLENGVSPERETHDSADVDKDVLPSSSSYHSLDSDMESSCPVLSYCAFAFAVCHWWKNSVRSLSRRRSLRPLST